MLPIVARPPHRTERTNPGNGTKPRMHARAAGNRALQAATQAGRLRLGAQDGGERLADILHLLHLHQVGKAVGALQGRS